MSEGGRAAERTWHMRASVAYVKELGRTPAAIIAANTPKPDSYRIALA